MIGLIVAGFLGGAAQMAGGLAGKAAWDAAVRDDPRQARALSRSMQQAIVRLVQASLQNVGIEAPITGDLDEATERAVKIFQAQEGLEQIDGIPGPVTLRALAGKLMQKEES